MKEVIKEVKTYSVSVVCSDCGWDMEYSWWEVTTLGGLSTAKHAHSCTKCWKEEILNERYPCIRYEYI